MFINFGCSRTVAEGKGLMIWHLIDKMDVYIDCKCLYINKLCIDSHIMLFF